MNSRMYKGMKRFGLITALLLLSCGVGAKPGMKTATFAGGCFWCMVPPFASLPGVTQVISGYAGGFKNNPTYKEVSSGATGHAESIQIVYDPAKISYEKLLDVFWRNIDPTDSAGQFVDRGSQYRSAIFFQDEEQQKLAIASREQLAKSGRFTRPIVTEITAFSNFYPAEEYHQDYYKKNPEDYERYHSRSGRVQFLAKIWGNEKTKERPMNFTKPTDAELKTRLNPLQYEVTQHEGTERPFQNEYWDNHAEGIYVDVVSGEVLFSSKDKFDSGTGWPSFMRPLEKQNVIEKKDVSHGMVRVEVRSKNADSHLGHLFDDGPQPTGLRYCMNSASMRFIAKENLEKEGYGEYLKLFQ